MQFKDSGYSNIKNEKSEAPKFLREDETLKNYSSSNFEDTNTKNVENNFESSTVSCLESTEVDCNYANDKCNSFFTDLKSTKSNAKISSAMDYNISNSQVKVNKKLILSQHIVIKKICS